MILICWSGTVYYFSLAGNKKSFLWVSDDGQQPNMGFTVVVRL